MKLKKVLACVAAGSVAVSALAVSAFAGKVTFSDSSWWTQKEITIEELLGGTDPANVESITFESDTNFIVAYNNTTGDGTIAEDNPYWSQVDVAANTPTDFTNIALESFEKPDGSKVDYALNVCLSKGDGIDYTISWTVNEKSGGTGNTAEFPADATLVSLKSTGVVNFDGAYRVNICHPWAQDDQGNLLEEHNILQDKSELSGAYTLGVHFDVAEFEDYGKSFNVDINVAENGEENVQAYWGAGNSANVGVTTTPVTVDGNGDYIVWATFAQPLNADGDNFFLDIITDITKQVEAATAEAGDGIPAISIREIAVQDEPVVTPGDSNIPEEPTPGDSNTPEEPTPGDSNTPGDTNFSVEIPSKEFGFTGEGVLTKVGDEYIVDIVSPENNLLGDNLSGLNGATAIGVIFEVSEFDEYGAPFGVDVRASGVDGITGAAVTDDGVYEAWAYFNEPIVVDDSFNLSLTTTIDPAKVSAIAAGDGLPAISLVKLGVQEEPQELPPVDIPQDDNNNNSSDTPSTGDNNNNGGDNNTNGGDNNTNGGDNNTSGGDNNTNGGDNNTNGGDNVNTGVSLSAVPAAIAAAALAAAAVVTKKRK